MRERLVEITHALAFDMWGGPLDAKAFKRALAHGAEVPGGPVDGARAFIVEGIPEDAVVSAPENNPIHLTYEYRVISDEWPDGGKSWFTPVAKWELVDASSS